MILVQMITMKYYIEYHIQVHVVQQATVSRLTVEGLSISWSKI